MITRQGRSIAWIRSVWRCTTSQRVYEIQAAVIKDQFGQPIDVDDNESVASDGAEQPGVQAGVQAEPSATAPPGKATTPKSDEQAGRGKRSICSALVDMVHNHFSHAANWFVRMDHIDRQESAGRGNHPFFRGRRACPRWSGYGDPPLLNDIDENSMWYRFTEMIRTMIMRETGFPEIDNREPGAMNIKKETRLPEVQI